MNTEQSYGYTAAVQASFESWFSTRFRGGHEAQLLHHTQHVGLHLAFNDFAVSQTINDDRILRVRFSGSGQAPKITLVGGDRGDSDCDFVPFGNHIVDCRSPIGKSSEEHGIELGCGFASEDPRASAVKLDIIDKELVDEIVPMIVQNLLNYTANNGFVGFG
jgi:hypothetical protein